MPTHRLGAAKIGLVTVTYNSGTVLPEFLNSLQRQDWSNYILYAIDNLSSDDSVAQLRRESESDPRVVVIANPDNRGVAKGNNQGIRAALEAGCDLVLLINNDVEFPIDLLSGMTTALEDIDADMLVPKIYYHEPANMLWCAGGRILPHFCYYTRHIGENEIDRGQYQQPMRLNYAPTCCMLIRRSVFERVGLMDETFFVYSDDADFCHRAIKAGLKLWYAPSPVLYHKVSSLTGAASDFTYYNVAFGLTVMMRKHGGIIAPLLLLQFQCIALIKLLLGRLSRHTYAVQQKGVLSGLRRRFSKPV